MRYSNILWLFALGIAAAIGWSMQPEFRREPSGATPEPESAPIVSADRADSNSEKTVTIVEPSLLPYAERDGEIFEGNKRRAEEQLSLSVFQKLFVFPDGEQIMITFDHTPRQPRFPAVPVDDDSGNFYASLAPAAAAGNGDAAIRLVEALDACMVRPKTESELADMLRRIDESGIPAGEPGRSREERRASAQVAYRQCAGADEQKLSSAMESLRRVADDGYLRAGLTLASRIKNTEPATARKYYERAWEAGDPAGSGGLGWLLRNQESPSYDDLVSAYAYSYVTYASQLALYDGLTAPMFDNFRGELLAYQLEIDSSTSVHIQSAGLELAKKLLVENKRCCR